MAGIVVGGNNQVIRFGGAADLRQEGFSLIFRTSQARALIEKMHILALLESFSAQKGFEAYFREIHKVKTLLHTMGERFMGLCYKMRIKSH